jgi:hypothetical protein
VSVAAGSSSKSKLGEDIFADDDRMDEDDHGEDIDLDEVDLYQNFIEDDMDGALDVEPTSKKGPAGYVKEMGTYAHFVYSRPSLTDTFPCSEHH